MRKIGKGIVNNSLCRTALVAGIAAGLMVFCTDCGAEPEIISLQENAWEDPAEEMQESNGEPAQPSLTGASAQESEEPAAVPASSGTVQVFVCGAVNREGVYTLPEGSRVYEAVDKAGGFREDADTSYVNQAAVVEDSQKLEIPTMEEAKVLRESKVEEPAARDSSAQEGKVNINTADAALLETIPGIGAVKAQKIIDYRNENGLFGSIEEITNVSGIGETSFRNIRDYITVDKINSG